MNRISLLLLFRELGAKALTTKVDEGNSYHGLRCDFKNEWKNSKLSKIKDFPQRIYSIPFKEYLSLWEYIQERENENRIFMKDYSGKIVPFKFSSCLYEVFHSLANKFNEDFIDKNIEMKMETYESFKGDKDMLDYIKRSSIYEVVRPPSGRSLSCSYTPYLFQEHKGFNMFNKRHVQKLKDDMIEISLFWNFQDALTAMSLTFNINKYAGQDYDNAIGKDTLKFIQEINKEYNQWIKEEWDDF